jgi:hypothetical protein
LKKPSFPFGGLGQVILDFIIFICTSPRRWHFGGELDEARDALRQAVETKPDLCSDAELKAFLRECSPQYVNLYRKTVYAGLFLAGSPRLSPISPPCQMNDGGAGGMHQACIPDGYEPRYSEALNAI